MLLIIMALIAPLFGLLSAFVMVYGITMPPSIAASIALAITVLISIPMYKLYKLICTKLNKEN